MADITFELAAELAGRSMDYHFSPYKSENRVPCPNQDCDGKAYVNLRNGMWHCFKCGHGGSAIDFYAALEGISGPTDEVRKEAGKLFNKKYGQPQARPKRKPKKAVPEKKQFEIAPPEKLHATYSRFLEFCTLEDSHKSELLERGFSMDAIEEIGFKSVPLVGTKNICREMAGEGFDFKGVPLFWENKGQPDILPHLGPGYFIKSRNPDGLIWALQTCLPKADRKRVSGPKYRTISTDGYQGGTKGRTYPHFNPGNGGTALILTEGPLKADLISHLSGHPTLAVMGVECLNYLPTLLPELRKRGFKTVEISYDMDMYENPKVYTAYLKLKRIVISAGLSVVTREWDVSHKGLDDFLWANRRK